MHYNRNDYELVRNTFRVRGDVLEIMPAYEEDLAYRIEFFGDEIERISEIDPLTGQGQRPERTDLDLSRIAPRHPRDVRWKAHRHSSREELKERADYFEKEKK